MYPLDGQPLAEQVLLGFLINSAVIHLYEYHDAFAKWLAGQSIK